MKFPMGGGQDLFSSKSTMARFYATFPSLSIHFVGCYDLARFEYDHSGLSKHVFVS